MAAAAAAGSRQQQMECSKWKKKSFGLFSYKIKYKPKNIQKYKNTKSFL
jgi:hypothetical protein